MEPTVLGKMQMWVCSTTILCFWMVTNHRPLHGVRAACWAAWPRLSPTWKENDPGRGWGERGLGSAHGPWSPQELTGSPLGPATPGTPLGPGLP